MSTQDIKDNLERELKRARIKSVNDALAGRREAVCTAVDPLIFDADKKSPSLLLLHRNVALRVCAMCPIAEQCLTDAMREERGQGALRYTIRGGKTASERAQLAKGEGVCMICRRVFEKTNHAHRMCSQECRAVARRETWRKHYHARVAKQLKAKAAA